MPGRDGTGPMGQGTMSGRGLGYCTGIGHGFGRGMGLGYGVRRCFGGFNVRQLSCMTDKEVLTEQKELLNKRLDAINKQLDCQSESD